MDACLKHNIKRFIYASTIYVYSKDGGFIDAVNSQRNIMLRNIKTFNLDYTIPVLVLFTVLEQTQLMEYIE